KPPIGEALLRRRPGWPIPDDNPGHVAATIPVVQDDELVRHDERVTAYTADTVLQHVLAACDGKNNAQHNGPQFRDGGEIRPGDRLNFSSVPKLATSPSRFHKRGAASGQ